MAEIEDLISALLPLLPEAEVRIDASGEVVIHTGLTVPANPPTLNHTQGDRLTSSRESRTPAPRVGGAGLKLSGIPGLDVSPSLELRPRGVGGGRLGPNVQLHNYPKAVHVSPDELPVIDIHSL